MSTYTVTANHQNGNLIMALPARNIQGEIFLSKNDQMRFSMPLYEKHLRQGLGAIFPGKIEIRLYRGSIQDSNIVFAGPLWDMTASSKEGNISCACEGIGSYFDLRRIDWDWDVTGEQALMIWNAMVTSQGLTDGDLGITLGTLNGTGPDRHFLTRRKEGKYIADILNDTANLNDGFDWLFNPSDRKFSTWYPYKQDDSTTQLEYGKAIQHYSIQTLGKYEANDILAQGPKEMVDYAFADTERSNWGLRQTVVQYKDAPTRDALQQYASQVRKQRQRGKTIPSLSVRGDRVNPWNGDLWLGEQARVLISDGAIDYDETMRCVGFQFTINVHGAETFVFYLNQLDELGA